MARKTDQFRPKFGIPRSRDDRVAGRYLKKIGRRLKGQGRKITLSHAYLRGSHTGFGAKAGRMAKVAAAHPQNFRNRRVVIKTRIARLNGANIKNGVKKLSAHLKYIERDGVSKEGEQGQLYNATSDKVDRGDFVEQVKEDRHTFRFIVSPEDAHEIADLKAFTRELMADMEKDLGTKLDWVAADHFNTDNPHSHITVRGITDQGDDLVIARDYIKHGMRHRASEILTRDLGPRQDQEIAQAMRREVTQDRFTSIDHDLVTEAKQNIVSIRAVPKNDYARLKQSLKQQRLNKLSDLGLAEEIDTGVWQLSAHMTDTLKRMGERGDIIKLMHRDMTDQGLSHADRDYAIFDAGNEKQIPVVGRIISKGLADELKGTFYIIVDGIEGRTHYAEVGEVSNPEDYPTGGIITISPHKSGLRNVDKVIAGIAVKEQGFYDEEAHQRYDPKASKGYIQTHARRLEALRRAGIVTRLKDGSWQIPSDYEKRVTAYGQRQAKRNPVRLNILTSLDINQQVEAEGATWLDRRLVTKNNSDIATTGFGAEVQDALQKRRAYLLQQGFAVDKNSKIILQRNLLQTLERRELNSQAAKISDQTGKSYQAMRKGQKISGTYSRQLNLTSGKFALIEKSKEFTLVPWRPVLDRALGKTVSGTVTGSGISWDITRQRGVSI